MLLYFIKSLISTQNELIPKTLFNDYVNKTYQSGEQKSSPVFVYKERLL